jgi:hypothetical protein
MTLDPRRSAASQSGPSSSEASYLDAILRLDPREDAAELFVLRRAYLGLSFPPAYPPPYAHLPQRLQCQVSLDQLREDVERLDAKTTLERAGEVEGLCLPDQLAWLGRLVRYAQERSLLDRLQGTLDPELLAVFRRVITSPVPEAVALKETFLQRLWARPTGSGMRKQVAYLRRAAPRLAELESEWLDQVAAREGPPFGRRHLAWILLALVYAALMLLKTAGS